MIHLKLWLIWSFFSDISMTMVHPQSWYCKLVKFSNPSTISGESYMVSQCPPHDYMSWGKIPSWSVLSISIQVLNPGPIYENDYDYIVGNRKNTAYSFHIYGSHFSTIRPDMLKHIWSHLSKQLFANGSVWNVHLLLTHSLNTHQ